MAKSTLESLLIHILKNLKIINPTNASVEEMAKEMKNELLSEWSSPVTTRKGKVK